MRRPWLRRLLPGLFVLSSTVAALAVLQWLRLLPQDELDRVDKISSGLGPTLAVIGLVVALASLWAANRAGGRAGTDGDLRAHLAARATRRLAREATRRELHPPYLQPTRWRGDAGAGTVGDLAAFLRDLPVRQLALVGAPGSGKSSMALRLAIDLLAAPGAADQPVPMLLHLASWDPDRALDEWLAATLRRQEPGLAERFGRDAAVRAAGLILPVLDGFDELPAAARPLVLRRLRDELAAGRPLVLVSRSDSFRAAQEQSGVVLPRATVVEVQPLEPGEAAAFLTAGQHDGAARWREVLRVVADKPRGGLARLLSSPLTIYLARAAYEDPATDPGELTGMTIPQARAALLAAYLPAVYGEHAHRADGSLRRYPAASAERWLRFLARRMVREERPALSWWQLPDLSPVATAALRTLVAVLAFAFMTMRYGQIDARIGLALGVPVALLARRAVGPRPATAAPARPVLRAGALAAAVTAGAAAGVVAAGLVLPGTGLAVAALFGLTAALGTAFVVNVLFGGVRPAGPADLRDNLRADRNVLLLAVAAIAVLPGLRSALQWGWWSGVQQFARAAALLLIALGAANLGVPWLRFAWARLALAATGRIPPALLTFLDDAHRRGVLKVSGTGYEFRHETLLRYLAGDAAGRQS